MTTIEIPKGYENVLLTAFILSLECVLIGFFVAGRARGKIFSKQFMEENFGEEHKKAFNKEIGRGGYPDVGSGYYSSKLNYADWFHFNNAQRAHMNFVEMLTPQVVFLLIAGLQCSCFATYIGIAMIVGRLLYALGYAGIGPKGRSIGVLLNDLALLASLYLCISYFCKVIKCCSGETNAEVPPQSPEL